MHNLLAADLIKFGAIESSIRWLDEASPENINYLDLIPSSAKRSIDNNDLWPAAIIESAGIATAYILCAESLSGSYEDKVRLNRLRHRLACRGGMTYLVAWKPGQMTLYPVSLSSDMPESISFSVSRESPEYNLIVKDTPGLSLLFQDVANAVLKNRSEKKFVSVLEAHQTILYMLGKIASAIDLNPALQEYSHDVNSLITHVLFTRILIDRGIINETTFPALYKDGPPERCFDTPELATITCQWLFDIFNGELPSLSDNNYANYFSLLASKDAKVFAELSKIFHPPYEGRILSFDMQWLELYWKTIDFAHVPVVILSQAYEHCSRILSYQKDDADSISQIPIFTAEFLIVQALAGITTAPMDHVKIFDAEASNAIRLNLYLRKLVAARWKSTENRPDRKEIKDILYGQIFGCDIDETALKISALSIFLTASELDSEQFQQESFKFTAISDHNFYVAPEGNEIPAALIGKFDLVIGNRDDDILSFSNVNHATYFAKKGGVVVFELGASLLTDCSENGLDSRDALFSTIRVTGVLNGGDLDSPLYLMFAVKLKSSDSDIFYMVSPAHDEDLWKAGRFRIDYSEAQPIQVSIFHNNPTLVNVLATGTTLDVDVIRRIHALLPANVNSLENSIDEEIDNLPVPRYGPAAVRLSDYWKLHPEYASMNEAPSDSYQAFISSVSNKNLSGDEITKYLFVLENSELFSYYMLMTKPHLPNIPQSIDAEDKGGFVTIPYEDIPISKKAELQRVLVNFDKYGEYNPDKLNEWVYDLYQLDAPDQQIIANTLATRLPNESARSYANKIPDDEDVKVFCSKLKTSMQSFFNGNLTCRRNEIYSRSWIFIDIFCSEFREGDKAYSPTTALLDYLQKNEGATRAIINMDKGYLCVGIMAQRMYFTGSRAQLCALDILRNHADFIPECIDG